MSSRRIKAAKAGESTYISDKPCKHGHAPIRYTSTGGCVECVKIRATKRDTEIRAMLREARAEQGAD